MKSVGDLVEPVGVLVPLVLDDDLLVAELLLCLAINQVEDLVELLSHARISSAQGLHAVSIESGLSSVLTGLLWRVKYLGLELEVEFLELCAERCLLLWHAVADLTVVIIDAQINELVIHLVHDGIAGSVVLCLQLLGLFFLLSHWLDNRDLVGLITYSSRLVI